MLVCHHCRKSFEPPEHAEQIVCPNCRAVMEPNAPSDWISIARCASIAEAGYLANVLSGHGVESNIEQHDSFSAIDGSWNSMFLLKTPAADAELAAEAIRERLAVDDDAPDYIAVDANERAGMRTVPTSDPRWDASFDPTEEPAMLGWRPIVILLCAGAAVLVVGLQMREARVNKPSPRNEPSLVQTLQAINRPFVSARRPGDPQRFRLIVDPRSGILFLERDADGDGHYEARKMFQ